jgi:hypothetical protein
MWRAIPHDRTRERFNELASCLARALSRGRRFAGNPDFCRGRLEPRTSARHPAHAAHPAILNKDAKGAAREAHKAGSTAFAPLHGSNYHPPYAAIVVDDNTDQTIYEVNADEPRHPASLTKIMTLYMLFEELEAGKLKLDTPLPVSAHAAGMAPVKLGLKAGQTILVEGRPEGDGPNRRMMPRRVAEAIGGGDEAEGAGLMTAKARRSECPAPPMSTARACRPKSRSPPPAIRRCSA